MTNVVILGHGGYGTATERNMNMLVGAPESFRFIDFDEQDDLNTLKEKIKELEEEVKRLKGEIGIYVNEERLEFWKKSNPYKFEPYIPTKVWYYKYDKPLDYDDDRFFHNNL